MCFTILIFLLSSPHLSEAWTDNTIRKFPSGFVFGTATAAYQIEGGWDADGKGVSIWDTFVRQKSEAIADGSTGDVAADSYHHYQRDVEMLRELGADFYRFSVSWPRVLPTGFANEKNEAGFQYYDNLINELTKYNIDPMVTMYHSDLPQILQDLGGWANPLSVYWFQEYARSLFERFGDRVKYWLTFNQPNFCVEGYGEGSMAPGVKVEGVAEYICVRNVLLAHAKVWHLYNTEYRRRFGGSVGIAIAVNWADPLNNSTENVQATEEFREFTIGLYMNPIFSKEGDFPKVVKDVIAEKSKKQGFSRSRLPVFSGEEIKLIRGSADFLGMNHYTTFLINRPKSTKHEVPSFGDDVNAHISYSKLWKRGNSAWLRSVPYGLYKACLYLNQKYDYPPIYITEHGWSMAAGLHDQDRIDNLRNYLDALLLAMEDGTEVRGFTVWSLLDNFEWTAGYSERFGLYEVDFNSEGKERTARKSALVYKEIITTRIVDRTYDPKSLDITISTRRLQMKPKLEL